MLSHRTAQPMACNMRLHVASDPNKAQFLSNVTLSFRLFWLDTVFSPLFIHALASLLPHSAWPGSHKVLRALLSPLKHVCCLL